MGELYGEGKENCRVETGSIFCISRSDKAKGQKQEIIVEDEPVFATKESVMHAMPVGEQMHWIKRKAADFCVEALR